MIYFLFLLWIFNLASGQLFGYKEKAALQKVLEPFEYDFANNADLRCDLSVIKTINCAYGTSAAVVGLKLEPQKRTKVYSLPTQIGLLTNLLELEIRGLWQVALPTELGNLKKLRKLRLYEAFLTRPVPAEISNREIDCFIESEHRAGERYFCTSCKPTFNCVVHPPDDCYDSCYLLEENETILDIVNTTRDADLNPDFQEQYGTRLMEAKGEITSRPTFPAQDSTPPVTSQTLGPTQGTEEGDSETQTGDVSGQKVREKSPDYTVVYIIASVLAFIVLMALISLSVYYVSANRSSDSGAFSYLTRGESASTNYTSASNGPAQYGRSTFNAVD